jgi:DNA-3-methyladenine glycosylase
MLTASHGKVRIERSSLMFDTYGYIYVYLIYCLYYCLNFTTDKDKVGAVSIRAVKPFNWIEELKIIRER